MHVTGNFIFNFSLKIHIKKKTPVKWNDTFYNTVYLSYPIPRKIYGKKNIIKLKSTSMDLPSENYLWYAMWYTIDSVHIPANTDKHGLSGLTYPLVSLVVLFWVLEKIAKW